MPAVLLKNNYTLDLHILLCPSALKKAHFISALFCSGVCSLCCCKGGQLLQSVMLLGMMVC